ncbi:phage terminase large subunit [Nesterenkonia flava]|uniref:Phage terminase large subunit n=1 Tax=Nesterenkonia flava TaxID=469799 RepID=A0ABU1FTF6_9MICC|nr:phage terminase large subunit [Nesterenkonia flava]MDR5711431.1 phage terminase large subunit [Nesterenkonia flava]
MPEIVYEYTPHPMQELAHATIVDELMYGGAKGGGKSRMARAEAVKLALQVPGSRSIILRQSFKDLHRAVETHMRKEIPLELASYNKQDHEFVFTNGSIIELGYLSKAADLDNYQGAEYQLVILEEATQFTEEMYTFMRAQLRASGALQERLEELGIRPRSICTTNPGGIGHHWVKKRFVDPYPRGGKVFRVRPTEEDPNPRTRVFIPAKVDDNPSLGTDYVHNLRQLPPEKQRAYLDGDWDIIEGVRFSQWRTSRHIIDPEQIPITGLTGRRVIAVDYGYSNPFAAVWLCELADGMIVQYREAYETELTARQQAELIKELSAEEDAITGTRATVVMDPSMWRRPDATGRKLNDPNAPPPGSPAHDYQSVLGYAPIRAVNNRVHGWAQLDEKLKVQGDGYPRYLVYSTCKDTIRTIPALPRDKKNPEDVDTSAEDHIADALRYGLMHFAGNSHSDAVSAPSPRRRGQGVSDGIREDRF